MAFSYSTLIRKADTYLRDKRRHSGAWRILLPEKIFSSELWLWESRSVSIGVAWGMFWAIAPVPMQSLFAVLCAAWSRANIPIALTACWLSFPGYQIIVWPFQWWVGHLCFSLFGAESDLSPELAQEVAQNILNHPGALQNQPGSMLPTIISELLLGCLITCTLAALIAGCTTKAAFRIFRRKGSDTSDRNYGSDTEKGVH